MPTGTCGHQIENADGSPEAENAENERPEQFSRKNSHGGAGSF